MAPALDLPDSRRLWLHPSPSEPTPNTKSGWSTAARRRWLDGCAGADPAELFKAMAEMFPHFIDLPAAHAAGVTATAVCWAMLTYSYSAWDAVVFLHRRSPRVWQVPAVRGAIAVGFPAVIVVKHDRPPLFRTLHSQGGPRCWTKPSGCGTRKTRRQRKSLQCYSLGTRRAAQQRDLNPWATTDSRRYLSTCFGAKALACIAGLPPALASRCIPVTMFRSPPGSEKPRRRIDADPAGWQRLAMSYTRWRWNTARRGWNCQAEPTYAQR